MLTYYIETFGCQMNVADSGMLAGLLQDRGYVNAESSDSADFLIVNTCSVRDHAEARAKARISEYARIKKIQKSRRRLWVIGCMAERLGDSLKSSIPGIDRVIGAPQMEYLPGLIDSFLDSDVKPSVKTLNCGAVSAFLPVMRGCNNYCSYCVVPFVRGREKSVSAAEVVGQALKMSESGVKEITLLGQNVNSYMDKDIDFAQLIEMVHEVKGIDRIRFTTSHPKDCSEKLVRTVASLPKCCKHFHMPVQSGSDRILKAMNRGYTREYYLSLVEKIRSICPDADITTDVMTGFPSETEDDFKDTVSLFEYVQFTTAFMFAYSPRSETKAADMPDQIPESVAKQRLQTIISLQTSITRNIYQGCVGKTVNVLFDKRQTGRQKAWMGQDNGCKRVLLCCDSSLSGTILPVRIVKSSGMTLVSERV